MSNEETRTPSGLIVEADVVQHALTEQERAAQHQALVELFTRIKACHDNGIPVVPVPSSEIPEPYNGLLLIPQEMLPVYSAFLMGELKMKEPDSLIKIAT